ncbi:hypothetical protein CBR_g8621 [Chara braunii]|uniref:Uncharacterized protein n=1 Tax=Chara braunii TaxID=69332 RepID=A0A388JS48_CHABU|nr:hypothetical protein CBR_g8621 [Chara braunii]|eukprot:GBG60600.1 hypothetical protein CBR_g8621 [Chara braunii]
MPTKKTHQFSNSVWEKPDVMHILFKGEDPQLLTHPVYEGAVAEDDTAALRRKQKVTPTDVVENPFKSLNFADIGNLSQGGTVYKDCESNPNQLCSQLLFFCGVVDAVLFLGKLHAQVVWNLLHSGRRVLAVEGNSTQLEYTMQFVAHEVQSGAYECDFNHVTSNKWLEVSSAFYSLPSSPSLKQCHACWELSAITPTARVVKRKSHGKDDEGDGHGGGQHGSGGGSEQRSAKRRSPEHEGGGEGKKGSGEKKKPHSGEKKRHHSGDGQRSNVDGDEDGATLAVTRSTSMETGNDFRPGWIPWPGEQDFVISSASATHIIALVVGTVVATDGTCPAQVQTQIVDCLGSFRTTETTSLSGTKCLVGSETTTYLGSNCDNQEPFSVPPHQEVRINPNMDANTVRTAHRSTKLEWTGRVSEHPAGEIRIHPNQEHVTTTTTDRCKDAEMLCVEVPKELQEDRSCFEVGVQDNAMESLEGQLAPTSILESRTLGEECPVTVCASLAVSAVKADTSVPLDSVGTRMNPNLGDVSMSIDDGALETVVIRMHPKQTDDGLELHGVKGCGHVTTFDKANGYSPLHSAGARIDPKPSDDPLYSGLHDVAIGENILKKASDAVKDGLLYLSEDDKDTAHEDNKFEGEEVLLDIDGTLSPTQYDTGKKSQHVNVVDLDSLSPEKSGIKLSVAGIEDLHHREEVMPSPIIDTNISNLSRFPGGLEHVVAASTRRRSPIVLGLPSVDSGDVEAKPGKH